MGGSVVSAMRLHYPSPQAWSQSATENRHAREPSSEGDGYGRGFRSTTCFSRVEGRDRACRHRVYTYTPGSGRHLHCLAEAATRGQEPDRSRRGIFIYGGRRLSLIHISEPT